MLQSILRRARYVAGAGPIQLSRRNGARPGACPTSRGGDKVAAAREHAEVICTEKAAFCLVAAMHLRQTARYKHWLLAMIPGLAGDRMATVLIADDDAAVRRLLSAVLRPRGHTIIEAGNGEQALELAGSANPELIVSDLMMPAMDGYELVRRLRIEPRTAQTPVIFLTAEYD